MPLPTAYTLLPYEQLRRSLSEPRTNFAPIVDDREAWERITSTPAGAAVREATLAEAAELAKMPNVPTPALSEFMAFARTGDRRTWEISADKLGRRLDAFSFAACFTGEEYWIEKAADAIWAICEMATWVTPAHEFQPIPDPDNPLVELWSVMLAQSIAEALQILQPGFDRIDPRIARRIRHEIDLRIFTPFLARGDWWWLFPQQGHTLNNWTAVCAGGVLNTALAILNDDPERLTQVVQKAAWSLTFFKSTFGEKGSLDEGVGYWAYGLSYFVEAAERLAARTNGQMNPLADPIWRDIAIFPLYTRLYGDTFVNFSDCAPRITPSPGWLYWLGEHLDVPGLRQWATTIAEQMAQTPHLPRHFSSTLRNLLWLPAALPASTPHRPPTTDHRPLSTYLPDVEWMIARSDASDDALTLVVKGGHNAENHNHNDGGSFIVHAWQEPYIAELGAPTYTRQFFSAIRYENIASRSQGHSVPFVNGQEQKAGREYAARDVHYIRNANTDTLTQDLAGFYGPEAKLVSLVRRLSFHRGTTDTPDVLITLSDHATFTEDNCNFSLPIITLDSTIEILSSGSAEIVGTRGKLTLTWDPTQATCHAEAVPTEDPKFLNADAITRIHRLWFNITVTGREGSLQLTMQTTKK